MCDYVTESDTGHHVTLPESTVQSTIVQRATLLVFLCKPVQRFVGPRAVHPHDLCTIILRPLPVSRTCRFVFVETVGPPALPLVRFASRAQWEQRQTMF